MPKVSVYEVEVTKTTEGQWHERVAVIHVYANMDQALHFAVQRNFELTQTTKPGSYSYMEMGG